MPMQTLEKPKSLRSQAVAHLRDAIVTGELEAGSMHSEQSLADRLSTSRTPIREALLQLAGEGFVEFIPQRGVQVTHINPEHLGEVFEYRQALDGYFAEKLAKDRPAHALELLDEQLQRQKKIIAKNARLEWARANMDFHVLLAEACGNSVMTDAMWAIASHTMRVGFQLIREKGRFQDAYDEHAAIVEAIRAGKGDRARALAMSHIRGTTEHMKRDIATLRPQ